VADGTSPTVSLPAGYSLESGAAPSGLPAGYTAESAPAAQPSTSEQTGVLERAGKGVAASAAESLVGLGKIGSKIPGMPYIAEKAGDIMGLPKLPAEVDPYKTVEEGIKPAVAEATSTPAGMIGYGGEVLTEFLLGDAALKALPLAEKLSHVSSVVKIFEKSPRIMRAVQSGADLAKLETYLNPNELEFLTKSPVIRRLVTAGTEALRLGTVQAAQTGVKTGDVKEAAKAGGEMGLVSAALGIPTSLAGGLAERAGKLGKTLETAKKGVSEAEAVAKGAEAIKEPEVSAIGTTLRETPKPLIEAPAAGVVPEHKEIASVAAQAVNKTEDAMHKTYDEGVKKITSDLAGKTIALDESPLAQAAKEARAALAQEPKGLTERLGKSLQGMIPGTERGEKMVGALLGEGKKAEDVTPSWLLGEEVKGTAAAEAPKAEALTVDNLVNYRQRLTKMLPQLAYDDPNKQVLYKLVNGVDDTIQKMADASGKPEISDFYKGLRNQYKDQVQFFNSASAKSAGNPLRHQVAQKLQSETLNNVPQYLLGGNNSLAKVQVAKELLGQESVDNLASQTIRRWAADAVNPETGKLNPKKLIDQWNKIPADTRGEFFSKASNNYRQMIDDLNKSPEVNKQTLDRLNALIRFGVFPIAGAVVGRETQQQTRIPRAEIWGALAGMLYGGGRREMANDMIKFMAEHPSYLKTAGKVAEAAKPVAKAVGPAVKQQVGQMKPNLTDVYGGAERPLSEPIQKEQGVYTNQ